jgi:F-type H+-transporting ATPase subunit epsilon
MPAANAFKASVITPEAILLEATITEAQIPVFDGLLGILHNRAPLLAKLGTGVLRLTTAEGPQRFLIAGGYAQMKSDELTILTSEAIPAASITAQTLAAEQAKLEAVQGNGVAAMEQRQAIQKRMHAMRALVS